MATESQRGRGNAGIEEPAVSPPSTHAGIARRKTTRSTAMELGARLRRIVNPAAVLLAMVALTLITALVLPAPAHAAQEIEFPNGGHAQMEDDGSITGTCQLTGGRVWPETGYRGTAIMPDGSRLTVGCYERYTGKPDHEYYLGPCDGTYTFTATKKGNGYFVLVHSQNAAGPAPGTIISTPPEGYTYQHAYSEHWDPDIVTSVQFNKISSDESFTHMNAEYSVAGARYDIFDAATDAKAGSIVISEDGKASCQLTTGRRYYAVEVSAPPGYVLNPKRVEFTATGSTVTLADDPLRVNVKIRKTDSATGGEAQVGASLEGAVFKLVDTRGNPQEAKTDSEGMASFSPIPLGDFTIVETKAPEGYKPDPTVHAYHVGADTPAVGGVIEFLAEKDLPNDIVAFDLELAKFKEDPSAEGSGVRWPAEGVVFELISKTTGKVVTTLTTDAYGFARTPDGAWYGTGTRPAGVIGSIPYDAKGYLVREDPSTVPEGYERMDDFTIEPTEQVDGVHLKYIIENATPGVRLCIVKTDAASGQTVPLAGFSFRLRDSSGSLVTQESWYPSHVTLNTFTTDETGTVTLPEQLVPGTYSIEEVAVRPPYLLGGKPLRVKLGTGGHTVSVARFANEQVTGRVTVTKSDSETGEMFAGAAFDIVAQHNISSPDGTMQAVAGEIVASITTGKDGIAEASGLPLGMGSATYALIETKPPEGFVLDPSAHEFTLDYVDGSTSVVEAHLDIEDTPVEIEVGKKETGSGIPLQGASFAVRQLTDQRGTATIAQQRDHTDTTTDDDDKAMVLTATTDEDGIARWSRLSPGSYVIEEIDAPTGYIKTCHPYDFTITESGRIVGDGFNEGTISIENDYTKIDVSKRDITNEEELPGAILAVYTAEGKLVERWTSTDQPHRIERLEPGTYTLKEERPPATHDIIEDVTFTVTATGEVQTVVMYDTPIAISGRIDKKQEIARPIATGAVANGDGKNRAEPRDDEEGAFDYLLRWQNTSNTWVDECTITDSLFCCEDGLAMLDGITTPITQGDYDGLLNVWYLTNLSSYNGMGGDQANATLDDGHENPWLHNSDTALELGDDGRALTYDGWRVWQKDIATNEAIRLSTDTLDLADDEHVIAVRFEYGRVESGFSTHEPDWSQDTLKDPHDDVAGKEESDILVEKTELESKSKQVDASKGPEKHLTPAVIHMHVTDAYQAKSALLNFAQIDLFRNGGGSGLEAHDMDQVEQTAGGLPWFPMPQTGDLVNLAVASSMTAGITALAIGSARKRVRARHSISRWHEPSTHVLLE